MKKAILNGYALNGYTVHSNLPIGTPIPWLSDNLPVGFLNCDHTKIKKSDYPELWDRLKDVPMCQSEETDYFFTPDLREITLVGVGENTTLTIAAHDVYELGQFKDDQLQGHWHLLGNEEGEINTTVGFSGGSSSSNAVAGNPNAKCTRIERALGLVDDPLYGTPRTGTTTHGKQFGVRWIIKATQYATVEQNAIDDTRFTTGNAWSAEKTKAEIDAKQKYSTEETVVGTYLDKPRYRKTIMDTYSSGTTILTDVEKLVNVSGMFQTNSTDWLPIGYIDNETNGYIRFESNNVKFYTNKTGKMEVTLEYTKTTD